MTIDSVLAQLAKDKVTITVGKRRFICIEGDGAHKARLYLRRHPKGVHEFEREPIVHIPGWSASAASVIASWRRESACR